MLGCYDGPKSFRIVNGVAYRAKATGLAVSLDYSMS